MVVPLLSVKPENCNMNLTGFLCPSIWRNSNDFKAQSANILPPSCVILIFDNTLQSYETSDADERGEAACRKNIADWNKSTPFNQRWNCTDAAHGRLLLYHAVRGFSCKYSLVHFYLYLVHNFELVVLVKYTANVACRVTVANHYICWACEIISIPNYFVKVVNTDSLIVPK